MILIFVLIQIVLSFFKSISLCVYGVYVCLYGVSVCGFIHRCQRTAFESQLSPSVFMWFLGTEFR